MKLFFNLSKTFLMIFINLLSLLSFGQTNTIKVLTDLGTPYDYANSIAIQNDGKVVVAGHANGTPCIIRFDTTGLLDNTFGTFGKVFASWKSTGDQDIKIQTDGKIVLGTGFNNGTDYDFIVARYNVDGTLDVSFGENGKAVTQINKYDDEVHSIAIQSDGKILVGGTTNVSPTGEIKYDFALIRYNSNGEIDSTFGKNGITSTHIGLYYNIAYSIAIQKDEKIILAGEANDSIFSDFTLVRYNSDGSLDNSFGIGGIVRIALSETYDYARSVVLQSDEKIVVSGTAQNGLSNENIALVRYTTEGSLDSTFGSNGVVITDISIEFANSVVLQPDNKIIVAGSYTSSTIYDFASLRYNADGSLDNSFGRNGLITTSFGNGDSEGNAVAIGNNGEIVIAGTFNHGPPLYFDFALVRLFSKLSPQSLPTLLSPPNGSTDQSINPTMTWYTAIGATSYNIQISTSPNFDNDVIYCTGLPSASFSVSGLNYNTTYYWKISNNNNEDTSEWSDVWSFSTIAFTDLTERNMEQIKLFPIPIVDRLFINGIGDEISIVSIFSVDGKLIRQVKGYGNKEINFYGIQNGIYLIKISNSNINYTKKILKQ
jgi:uncharacterized delta-60 repeat protein